MSTAYLQKSYFHFNAVNQNKLRAHQNYLKESDFIYKNGAKIQIG